MIALAPALTRERTKSKVGWGSVGWRRRILAETGFEILRLSVEIISQALLVSDSKALQEAIEFTNEETRYFRKTQER